MLDVSEEHVTDSFRLMVDAVADYAVFMLDPDGVVTTWNLGAERINGYRPAEIIGRHFSIFYPPEAIASGLPAAELASAIANGRHEDEGWRLRRDGSRLWANVIITALHDRAGKLVGFGKVTRDLSERRLIEEALRESNRQLSSVFECTSDSIMTIGHDWTIVYGNNRAARELPDCGLGRNYWECFPAVLGTNIEELLRTAMNARIETGYETFYQPCQAWFRVRIFPSAAGITAFFANVTEEKKVQALLASEQNLREQRIVELGEMHAELARLNDLLHSVMNSTSDGIVQIGFDWTMLYLNKVALALSPVGVGQSYWLRNASFLGTPVESEIRRFMEERIEGTIEVAHAAHGSRFTATFYPAAHGLSVFFTNVDVQRRLEEELARERMLRDKRIEALSHMAGGLAHEISNPLAIIHGRATDLRMQTEFASAIESKEVRRACDSIVQTSDRAIKILRGLKGFAREAGKDPMEWASIYDIVQQCVDLQQSRFDRHAIELRAVLGPGLPLLLCRETQIGQILNNLLNNAFDAIQQKGCSERWVTVSACATGQELSVDVIDSGPGIDEASRQHLMEPFFTTKTGGLGMGIGLSLSRAIAQEHGGTLTLCDDDGHTCFRMTLPLGLEPAPDGA